VILRERLRDLARAVRALPVARAVRALPGSVLRRSGPMEPLTRRNQLLDIGLALGLALTSILSYDGSDATFDRLETPRYLEPPLAERSRLPPVRPGLPGPEVIEHASGWDWAGAVLLLALIAAPLIFRRRYPLSTLWAVLVTATMVAERPEPLRLSFYACVIAAYSAAVYSPYRVPALASLPVTAFLMAELQQDTAEPALGKAINAVPQGAVPFLILGPIAVAAWGLRTLRARADAEKVRVTALERQSAEAVRRAAEEERARIARELHDVVTHNVSVMVIQAGAARKVLTASPEQAREALLSVEASGRAAMTELRHVMGLLTMDGGTPDLAPQPGMVELESLIGLVRDAGLPVELTVTGRPGGALPDGIDLTGYRVVQEALTNAVKHAVGASAVVRVDYGTDRLSIEVTDTGGHGSPRAADAGSGRGLIGLRERLALYGGTLHAGPRVRGGYRVAAVIPFDPAGTPSTVEVA
jgi:signal transduction histidine kinase